MKSQSKKLNSSKINKLFLRLAFTLLTLLLVSPCAYALKVQSGTATITNTNSSVTESITAVADINKAFLLMWSTGDNGTDQGEEWQATGYLSATNEITFERA